jgi:hypothetical protein
MITAKLIHEFGAFIGIRVSKRTADDRVQASAYLNCSREGRKYQTIMKQDVRFTFAELTILRKGHLPPHLVKYQSNYLYQQELCK